MLHEATRTGAPRVGGLIAGALKKYRDVRILCLQSGPLLEWLGERVGVDNVRVYDFDKVRHQVSFKERLDVAKSLLEQEASNIIYVNSLAASEFVVAAKQLGKLVVVHVHEKAEEMRKLLAIQLMKLEVLSMSDAVVLAAEGLERDIVEVFGFIPERVVDFGIAVDLEEVAELAQKGELIAATASGSPFVSSEKLVVGMVGHASMRKGVDLFYQAAKVLPEHDFIWVGNWGPSDAPENVVFDRFVETQLSNLYISGGVSNPYKYISRFDIFFLSSREDPNPVVLAEALILRVPILAFSKTTAVTDFLGRNAILCYGHTNLEDSVRVLKGLDKSDVRSDSFRPIAEEAKRRFNITDKIAIVNDLLDSLIA